MRAAVSAKIAAVVIRMSLIMSRTTPNSLLVHARAFELIIQMEVNELVVIRPTAVTSRPCKGTLAGHTGLVVGSNVMSPDVVGTGVVGAGVVGVGLGNHVVINVR